MLEIPLILLSQRSNRRERTLTPEIPKGALGTIVDTNEPFRLTAKDLSKHCYILGSTGCGKTSLILKLIEEDIKEGHSIVILDLRGDLVNGSLGLCERLKVNPDRVTLLDLRERERIQGFNPLGGAGEPYIRALHLLEVLANEAESWGVQLEETLRSALLLLAESGFRITEIEKVFYDQEFRSQCLGMCSDDSVVRFWERYVSLTLIQQQCWALPVLNKVTSLLAVPTLRHILAAESDLNLGELLARKGQILLVSLAVDELHRSARMMGSLVVSAISREMMARVNASEADRNPVRLYVDEFENMASESFESLIAEGRRFKLSLVLSHQTLSQLDKKLRSVIRNNVGIQILFQCGFEDAVQVQKELPDNFAGDAVRNLNTGESIVLSRSDETVLVKFHPPREGSSMVRVAMYRSQILARLPNSPARQARKVASLEEDVPVFDWEDWL